MDHFSEALATALLVARRSAVAKAVAAQKAGLPARVRKSVVYKAVEVEKKIAFAEVYVPGDLDVHGDFMTAEEIEKLAHEFMLRGLNREVDVDHDHLTGRAAVVESFIARKNDPDGFVEGAWVAAGKFFDDALWAEVKKGQKAGWSFEADVVRVPVRVAVANAGDHFTGRTEKSDGSEHTHTFTVFLNDRGNVVTGRTNTEDGHFHVIKGNMKTEPAEDGHLHTFLVPIPVLDAA